MTSLSFSLGGSSSKPSSRPSPPPTKRANGTKRDHAALLDDASDDEDTTHSKRQTITHFDTAVGGAINAKAPKKEEKAPLVISALANRDWREASKRQRAQKYGITAEQMDATSAAQIAQGSAQGADKVVKETEAVKYGLNVFAPSSAVPEEIVEEEQEEETPQQKTAEQLAIDALTGAAPTSTLTIPSAQVTEEDAFASSFHSAPPAPSLSDYTAVPVEEYGAAMLRGMGWKGPSTTPSAPTKNGKKALPPAKRPALLGIGADPNAAQQSEELGAWGKASSRRGKEPTMFIPVSMKNKRTGETLTEEELKNKIRRDKEEAENQRFVVNDLEIRDKKSTSRRDDGGSRRRDDYSDDGEDRRRRRDKEKDRNYDRHDRSKDHRDRRDKRDRSRDHRDSKRDTSRDRYEKKSSSHRRERSKDKDYERRDRDKDHERRDRDRRDRYDDGYKSSSRRDRSRDGGYRSSRR
ncbi:hypothetical protein M436DRAFT_41015 [Aureobasidium namibiae CBS 147.97]|uniref:Pre-mRNA-splicing factor n=1 Tax=Aureobasidium namibiae CBS 147.97 TaxID=1043004 RepID=A0A074WR85_9PEZI|nr:uncharacterized protein M436DRAFT_41015 [Aureobasidium namibiae CBS 147.97]KEQ75680.1 hypothetical protein M436DRAFT_41015 [Aureobasidium namibiae CBS 147.97]